MTDYEPTNEPDFAAHAASRSRRPGQSLMRAGLAVVAGLWLAASVVVGGLLMTGQLTDQPAVTAETPTLVAIAERSAYGGDAYTGIQNAAADTENAIVDGTTELAQFQLDLAQSQYAAAKGQSSAVSIGLGFLIIGVGLATFIGALQRLSDGEASVSSTR